MSLVPSPTSSRRGGARKREGRGLVLWLTRTGTTPPAPQAPLKGGEGEKRFPSTREGWRRQVPGRVGRWSRVLCAVLLSVLSASLLAQGFPSKPVRVLVGFP